MFSGNPAPNPGHNCAFLDSAGQHTWQSSSCGKKLGYVCYKDGAPPAPTQSTETYSTTLLILLVTHSLISVIQSRLSFVLFIISWARILFNALDSLQWPLLPPSAYYSNMVCCSERVPQRRRGLSEHSQCGGPKLCHLATWIRYLYLYIIIFFVFNMTI